MIFRRGDVYLVYEQHRGLAFTFDPATGVFSGEKPLAVAAASDLNEWLPVLADEPLPTALTVRLILRFPR